METLILKLRGGIPLPARTLGNGTCVAVVAQITRLPGWRDVTDVRKGGASEEGHTGMTVKVASSFLMTKVHSVSHQSLAWPSKSLGYIRGSVERGVWSLLSLATHICSYRWDLGVEVNSSFLPPTPATTFNGALIVYCMPFLVQGCQQE